MRIAIDLRPLLDPEPSGVGTFTLHLVDALIRSHEHEFVLFSSGMRRPYVPEAWHTMPHVRFVHWRVPNKLLNASLFLFRRPRFDRLITADAFLFPNLNFAAMSPPHPRPLPQGGEGGRRARMALVVHDLSFVINPQWFSWKERLWHWLIRPRALCGRADAIIAVSENTKMDLVEVWGVNGEKIAVVYPGINNCHPERAERVEGSPRVSAKGGSLDFARDDKPTPYVLYLGNLEPRKNLEALVTAFNDLTARRPDLPHHLVLAGKVTKQLSNLATKQSGGRDQSLSGSVAQWLDMRIHFLGYIPEEDKSALYAGASAFVYPSWYEGFGLPPLEAMAAGVPVVASNAASLSEVLRDAALLFDPLRPEQLSAALEAVFTDETLRNELIARGKARATEFTWEKAANEMVKLLSN